MPYQKDRLRRDMMNNGKIYESVEKMLGESIVPSAEVSKRYNATYGASDFNTGMLHAAMLDTSVGGCGLVMREVTAQSIENPRYSRHSPSNEWFRNILSKTDEGKALGTFNQAVRTQLGEICLLGRFSNPRCARSSTCESLDHPHHAHEEFNLAWIKPSYSVAYVIICV